MDFLDLVTLSQGSLEIMNPVTPEKIVAVGEAAGLKPGMQVLEVGAGNGTVLAILAEKFGITGTGLEIRPEACARAERMLAERRLSDQVTIICTDASTYTPEVPYDLVVCLGAAFIYGGLADAVATLTTFTTEDGAVILGERYWKTELVPPEFARDWQDILTEFELAGIAGEVGFDLSFLVRADDADWERYETGIWRCCRTWLKANPDHPEYGEVVEYLHQVQEEYLGYGREYAGWGMYLFEPAL